VGAFPALGCAFLAATVSGCAVAANQTSEPEPIAIAGITVGLTTLAAVRQRFGPAQPTLIGQGDEAQIELCYQIANQSNPLELVFLSAHEAQSADPVLASIQVAGFELKEQRLSTRTTDCLSSAVTDSELPLSNGLKLGMTRSAVEAALGAGRYARYWPDLDALEYQFCWDRPIPPTHPRYQEWNDLRAVCFAGKPPTESYCRITSVRMENGRVVVIHLQESSGVC
jgi:hypothetical protein